MFRRTANHYKNFKTLLKLQVKGQQDLSLSLIPLGLFQNTLRISYTEKGHYFNLPVVKILGQDGILSSVHIFQYITNCLNFEEILKRF